MLYIVLLDGHPVSSAPATCACLLSGASDSLTLTTDAVGAPAHILSLHANQQSSTLFCDHDYTFIPLLSPITTPTIPKSIHTARPSLCSNLPAEHIACYYCLQVSLDRVILRNTGPGKNPVQLGVTTATETPSGDLIIGGGDGLLAVMSTAAEPSPVNPKNLKKLPILCTVKLEGAITSAVVNQPVGKAGKGLLTAYVGTAACNIYKVTYDAKNNK